MPTQFVNLDALIRREDFEVAADPNKITPVEDAEKLKVVELESDSLMFKLLRKPDFQRTTAHWTPEKVAGFIKSFVQGDLIPAIILWRSDLSGSIFVIDGAHRLSALIAWVHDDYGDRKISLQSFREGIKDEQKKAADLTRQIIARNIGSYIEVKHANDATKERLMFASNLAARGVTLQWVKGNASRAEHSFHTINTEQTPIGEIELRLIRDRHCPNAIATRALISAGTGQQHNWPFPEENQKSIKSLAKAIYDDLFTPPLETPIKTLDLPVAGGSYSSHTMKLVLDMVEHVNKTLSIPTQRPTGIKRSRSKSDLLAPTMTEDADGSKTISYLSQLSKVSSRIAGDNPRSLGLHPAVYFYSATGNYQPTAFLAAISFIQELEQRDELVKFTLERRDFEELLLACKSLINHIVRHYGSGNRGLSSLLALYRHLFNGASSNPFGTRVYGQILEDPKLAFLDRIIDPEKGIKGDFSSERKSAIYLTAALQSAPTCGICGSRVHTKSISIDHIKRRSDGGRGSEENGQLTHPFCNSARDAIEKKRELIVLGAK